ncbi:diguanylate cyclase [Cupriavidus basilensis]
MAERTCPTVILQDLVMPGIDGLTLVQQHRRQPGDARHSHHRAVHQGRADHEKRGTAAGANDYLVKLPDTIELVARIRYHSRSYLNLQQRDEALPRAAPEPAAAARDQPPTAAADQLGRPDRAVQPALFRRVPRGGMETRQSRAKLQLALLMIDVDSFKAYNDTYGHVAGDEVLRRVAGVIRENCARPADLPARFGGEEFAMILPSTSPGGARLLAEKVRARNRIPAGTA